jgi:hypothetical protein
MGSSVISPASGGGGGSAQTLKGDLDCSTNPNYPSAVNGDTYIITVAGKVGGASGKAVEVGDMVIAKADNAGGTEGSVGSSWIVVQGNVAFTAAGLALATAADAAAQRTALGLGTTARPQYANLRLTHSTLTYGASVALDFDGDGFQTCSLTGDITFTTSNLAAGRSKTLRIVGDGSLRSFTFPAGWTFVGAAAPASLAANKVAVLTLTSFGTTDADVVAAYSAKP